MELPSTIERTREISQVLEDEEFLCIRDLLLGQNRVKADVAKALLLARSSNHPSSVRLSKWFEHEENVTPRRAQDVLRQIEDPLALCLAALVVPENIDRGLLKCASDLGNGFAKAELATKASGMDRFALANESMKLGERDGFYHMFLCYARGEGVDPAPEKTLHFCSLAAYFGHGSMIF
jgi:TPR repeat protein